MNIFDFSIYFTPCSDLLDADFFLDNRSRWGRSINAYTEGTSFPDLSEVKLAILGVDENRNSECGTDCDGISAIRKKLYNLFPGKFSSPIADLGNLKKGATVNDTYFALKEVLVALIRQDILPIIIGGSQDLTFANYQAYESLERIINLGTIDSLIDLGDPDTEISSDSYMSKIIVRNPNYLFNFVNIGYQTYLSEQDAINLMKKLHFESARFGLLRKNLEEAEPLIRSCDCISVDMKAIRKSDSPANRHSLPTGFSAEDMCQLMRYVGMSEQISSFGIYEYQPAYDREGQSAMLAAQMIWCFVDGFENRKADHPYFSPNANLKRYTVAVENAIDDIIFIKSVDSNRWWMELPCSDEMRAKFRRHYLIPCSYLDYQEALQNEVPEKWWRAYQKLV